MTDETDKPESTGSKSASSDTANDEKSDVKGKGKESSSDEEPVNIHVPL